MAGKERKEVARRAAQARWARQKKQIEGSAQQYRCAPIEAQNITRARLEAEFKHRMGDIKKLENAIARLIAAKPATCTPWRRSEIERLSCRQGMQTAALEFYWAHRQILENVTNDGIALQNG